MNTVTPMDEHTLKLVNNYLIVRGLPTMDKLPCKLFSRDPEVMRRLDAAGWEEFPAGSGSIRKKEQTITVNVPFGKFHLDGRWEPNYLLSMSAEEQRAHNEAMGALPKTEQSPSQTRSPAEQSTGE